jgi:hypothetical protein
MSQSGRRTVTAPQSTSQLTLRELRRAIDEYTTRFLSPLTEPERQRLAGMLGKLYVTTAEGGSPTSRWQA